MTENIEIKASGRDVVGKANRRLDGTRLPAVVYGAAVTAMPISVDRHEFSQLMSHESNISSKLIEMKVDDNKPLHVIVKGIQSDPRRGTLQHVDFWAVNMKQNITTAVPIRFTGDAPGVREGGVLMHSVQTVDVETLPDSIPESIEFDVSEMQIGDTVHVRDLLAPEGVAILDDEDVMVASLVPPVVVEEEEEEPTEEITEPEVIGEKPEEE